MEAAIRLALDRHRVTVHARTSMEAIPGVLEHAPDLVLLIGDATADGGTQVLRMLAENPATNVVPVALLSNDVSLDQRMRAFRSGAVAVVLRTASADQIGRQIAELARELPERSGEASGELGEATLDELVELVSRELRSGILTVQPGDDKDPVRLVLGAGGPVADALADFVHKLRPLIAKAEPLRYELLEATGGRISLFDEAGEGDGGAESFSGLRVLLMDNDPGRADVLAQALRDRGSLVAVTDVSVRGLERGATLDPEVVVLDAAAIEGPGFEAVRTLRRDVRLRWASLLVARWDELWPDPHSAPDLDALGRKVQRLVQHDRALRERAVREERFDTRLELTGPTRFLRALGKVDGTRHLIVRSPKATLELDVADGLIVGAKGTRHRPTPGNLEGTTAVAALLALSSGRVQVERRGHPSVANVMAPVDEALAAAAKQEPPVQPSIAPPSGGLPELVIPSSTAPELEDVGRPRDLSPFPSAEMLLQAAEEGHLDADDDEGSGSGPLLSPHLRESVRDAPESAAPTKGDLRWEDSGPLAPPTDPGATARPGEPEGTADGVVQRTAPDAPRAADLAAPPMPKRIPTPAGGKRPPSSAGFAPPPVAPRAASRPGSKPAERGPSARGITPPGASPEGRAGAEAVRGAKRDGSSEDRAVLAVMPPVKRSAADLAKAKAARPGSLKRTMAGLGQDAPASAGTRSEGKSPKRAPFKKTMAGLGDEAEAAKGEAAGAQGSGRTGEPYSDDGRTGASGADDSPGRSTPVPESPPLDILDRPTARPPSHEFPVDFGDGDPDDEPTVIGDRDALAVAARLSKEVDDGVAGEKAVAGLTKKKNEDTLEVALDDLSSIDESGGTNPGMASGVLVDQTLTDADGVPSPKPKETKVSSTPPGSTVPRKTPPGRTPHYSSAQDDESDDTQVLARSRRQRRWPIAIAAVLLLALAGGAAGVLFLAPSLLDGTPLASLTAALQQGDASSLERPPPMSARPSAEGAATARPNLELAADDRTHTSAANAGPASNEAGESAAGAADTPANQVDANDGSDAHDGAVDEGAADEGAANQASDESDGEAEATAEAGDAADGTADEPPSWMPNVDALSPERGSDVLVVAARGMIHAGELDHAAVVVERARTLDQRNPRAMAVKAELHLARGEIEQAIEWAEVSARLRSRRASYQIILGDAYQAAGREDEARAAWRRALQLEPNHGEQQAARQRLYGD